MSNEKKIPTNQHQVAGRTGPRSHSHQGHTVPPIRRAVRLDGPYQPSRSACCRGMPTTASVRLSRCPCHCWNLGINLNNKSLAQLQQPTGCRVFHINSHQVYCRVIHLTRVVNQSDGLESTHVEIPEQKHGCRDLQLHDAKCE